MLTQRNRVQTLLAFVLLAACSNSGGDGIPRERFAAELAAAACDGIAGCCEHDGHRYDEAGCHTARLESTRLPAPDLALEYDPGAAAECVQTYRTVLASCTSGGFSGGGCNDVFRPTLKNGERCRSYEECIATPPFAYGLCLPAGPDEPGVCTKVESSPARSSEGDACGGTCWTYGGEAYCDRIFARDGACFVDDGLACSPASAACTPLPVAGEECAFNTSCAAGLFCAPADCGEGSCTGVCRELLPFGAACEPYAGDVCVEGAVCIDVACGEESCPSECRPVAGEGESCDPSFYWSCAPGLSCARDTERCESPRDAGQPCARRDVPCSFELYCDQRSGVCETPRAIDAPCLDNRQCASLHCSTDTGLEGVEQSPAIEGVCRAPRTTSRYDCSGPFPAYPQPTATQPGSTSSR